MSDVLILTEDQRNTVRGPSAVTPGAALEPVALLDGSYFLGVAVMADPDHAEHKALLETLPMVPYALIRPLVPPTQADEALRRTGAYAADGDVR